MSLLNALLMAGRGPCSVGLCICRRICPSSLTFAFTIDIYKIARSGDNTYIIFCPHTFLQSFLHHTCYTNSVVANELHDHLSCKSGCLSSVTLKQFFFSSLPIFSFYHQALYFPALLCLLQQHSFLFLLPKYTCREACSVPTAASGCCRRHHLGFLPLSPGNARSSPQCCCIIAAFPDAAETQSGRLIRAIFFSFNHGPPVPALCPSSSHYEN